MKPDQLGSPLDGCDAPDLWFLDELTVCAAQVLARSGGGQLHFVGRSADSVFDVLSGALAQTSWADRLQQLPFSFRGDADNLTQLEISRARSNFTDSGLDPPALARNSAPVVFVDMVFEGHTFSNLYRLLRPWVEQERTGWDVVRRKLRFIGITSRRKTSPNTWRWQQHADWTGDLPAQAVVNVSIAGDVWSYLGDYQTKLTRSFQPALWTSDDGDAPRHDEKTRHALAEAVAIVSHGRTRSARDELTRVVAAEPTFKHAWLRDLVLEMRRSPG